MRALTILRHGPDGRFLEWGGALAAWFDVLMEKAGFSALESMLALAMAWCSKQAGIELCSAGNTLHKEQSGWSQTFAERRMEGAKRWFTKKAILAETLEKLKAVQ